MVANYEGVRDQSGLKHGIGFGSQAANFESSAIIAPALMTDYTGKDIEGEYG